MNWSASAAHLTRAEPSRAEPLIERPAELGALVNLCSCSLPAKCQSRLLNVRPRGRIRSTRLALASPTDLRLPPADESNPFSHLQLARTHTHTNERRILSQTKLNGRFGPIADARKPGLKSLRNIHLDRTANLSSLDATLCAQLPKLATL